MIAILRGGQLVLFRRVARNLVHWRTVAGTDEQLLAALVAAQKVTELAQASGGWPAELGRLGFDPEPPIPTVASTRLLLEDRLDRRLR